MKEKLQNKQNLTPEQIKLKKKNQIIIVLAVVIIISLIAVILYLLFHKENTAKDSRPTVITEDNIDDVINSIDAPVKDGSYEIIMNTEWKFNGKASDAYVANSDNNTRTVYFDVNLADTGELVYSSPYIPVGKSIKGFTLDSKLKAGNYKAVLTYHLVDDNKEEVSNLSVNVTFQVN